MTPSIFHFFADITKKRQKFISSNKLEKFPFDRALILAEQVGTFPDLALHVNVDSSNNRNPHLQGGELIELKDSKSYSVSSFNSTIPTGEKDVTAETVRVGKKIKDDPNTEILPMRQIYYLLRGRYQENTKVCLVHGSFFETVPVKELITDAIRQVLDEASDSGATLSEEEKEKVSNALSQQELFSSVRRIKNASVRLRFRIMTEVGNEGNIFRYPEIKDDSLNFAIPVHGKSTQERKIEVSAICKTMETEDILQGVGERFFIKHPLNGYFWVLQIPIEPE